MGLRGTMKVVGRGDFGRVLVVDRKAETRLARRRKERTMKPLLPIYAMAMALVACEGHDEEEVVITIPPLEWEELDYGPPVVTLAEYEQIQPGQTYEQVVDIIGDPGKQISSVHMPGTEYTRGIDQRMYEWKNPDFSSASITFRHGRVTTTMQFGLE
jgi:hypothetical protein